MPETQTEKIGTVLETAAFTMLVRPDKIHRILP